MFRMRSVWLVWREILSRDCINFILERQMLVDSPILHRSWTPIATFQQMEGESSFLMWNILALAKWHTFVGNDFLGRKCVTGSKVFFIFRNRSRTPDRVATSRLEVISESPTSVDVSEVTESPRRRSLRYCSKLKIAFQIRIGVTLICIYTLN